MTFMIRNKPKRVPLGELKRDYSHMSNVPNPNDFIFDYEFIVDEEDEEVLTYDGYSYKDTY